MNKKLVNRLFDANVYTQFFRRNGHRITKKLEEKSKSVYRNELEDSKFTNVYKLNGHELEYFYQVSKGDDIGKKIIECNVIIPPVLNNTEIPTFVNNVFTLDRRYKVAHINVPINSKLYNQLLKFGARNVGTCLLCNVDDSLKYLKSFHYDKSIEVTVLRQKDLKEVVELEYLSHKNSLTSRCENMPRKMFEGFFKSLLKHKVKVILVKENGVILGLIVPSINGFKIGHIMSISVKYDEQGRGVAKLLYFEAMKYLKSQGVKVYTGVTTTTEVLSLASRLKREAVTAYLEVKL